MLISRSGRTALLVGGTVLLRAREEVPPVELGADCFATGACCGEERSITEGETVRRGIWSCGGWELPINEGCGIRSVALVFEGVPLTSPPGTDAEGTWLRGLTETEAGDSALVSQEYVAPPAGGGS